MVCLFIAADPISDMSGKNKHYYIMVNAIFKENQHRIDEIHDMKFTKVFIII